LNGFGKENIFLKVHPNNPAVKLYRKVGFAEAEIINTEHGPRIVMD
jgi:ribosomal protein S18 acetylase RimI-like enzyme